MDSVLRFSFGERSSTKVAAVYATEGAARTAARRMEMEGHLFPSQVRVLGPMLALTSLRGELGRQIEPEGEAIWNTLLRAHGFFGAAGALAGTLVFVAMLAFGSPLVSAAPVAAFFATLFIATMLGLLAGGLVSLRPDHGRLMSDVRRALSRGRWVVLTHPYDGDEADRVRELLGRDARQIHQTL